MSDERLGGLALIAGAAGFIVTMVLHPTGHDLVEPERFERARALAVAVHALAIACLPVTFAGALMLTRRLAASRLAVLALVVHGVALVGALVAAAVNGIAVPNSVEELLAAEGVAREAWGVALHHAHVLNQAFAGVYVVASCAAIVAWSAAMLRARAMARGLALYGIVLGIVVVVAFISGHVRLDVHGFGAIVLAQAVWYVTAGALLWRAESARERGAGGA